MDELRSGTRLAGRYRLIRTLDTGGMAAVWVAHDQVLDREVAVKVPRGGWARDPAVTDRLLSEARLAAGLSHPAITPVHDFGIGHGHPFIVMELLRGRNLAEQLASGPLSWDAAAGTFARLAEALAAAHEAGVLHRDIKPANIFLTSSGARLLDFGIAMRPDAPLRGPLIGTPDYMAPEVLADGPATPAADVYSLAVSLIEAAPARPGSGAAAEAVSGAAADDPARRPTAGALARALGGGGGGDGDPAGTVGRTGPVDPGEREATRVLLRPLPPRRWQMGAAAAAGALIMAAAAYHLGNGGEDPPPRAGAPTPETSRSEVRAADTACRVDYAVRESWPGGFKAEVRITNLGAAEITGWTLRWRQPAGQGISQLWNGEVTQAGEEIGVRHADWNVTIPRGGSAGFGFLGRSEGDPVRPDAFTLNGEPCAAETR